MADPDRNSNVSIKKTQIFFIIFPSDLKCYEWMIDQQVLFKGNNRSLHRCDELPWASALPIVKGVAVLSCVFNWSILFCWGRGFHTSEGWRIRIHRFFVLTDFSKVNCIGQSGGYDNRVNFGCPWTSLNFFIRITLAPFGWKNGSIWLRRIHNYFLGLSSKRPALHSHTLL